jgi:hypothetical protein
VGKALFGLFQWKETEVMKATRNPGKSTIDNQAFSEVGFRQASIPGAENSGVVCRHPNQRVEREKNGSHWQYCCKKDCTLRLFVR